MRRAALSALLFLLAGHNASAGLVTKAGDLAIARNGATATLLADGRVLIAGGHTADARLEIFDPRTGRSIVTNESTELPLLGHTATTLADGRVLLAGGGYRTDGRPYFGNYGSTTSEAYAAGALVAAGRMNHFRKDHTGTLLNDGRVLITGGQNVNIGGFHLYRDVTDSAEIFDPATNTFRLIASMHEKRAAHTATRLRDGRVLIAGGATLEIFDPQTETFIVAGTSSAARANHTATLLADGRVLLAGGTEGSDVPAEIYDPSTNELVPAGDVGDRRDHTATLLPNGQVLIAGGAPEAVVWDPDSSEIVERFSFDVASHSATLLPDGSVLLAAGGKDFVNRTDVLRYRPAPHKTRRRAVR